MYRYKIKKGFKLFQWICLRTVEIMRCSSMNADTLKTGER